jgi:hypothetical protein
VRVQPGRLPVPFRPNSISCLLRAPAKIARFASLYVICPANPPQPLNIADLIASCARFCFFRITAIALAPRHISFIEPACTEYLRRGSILPASAPRVHAILLLSPLPWHRRRSRGPAHVLRQGGVIHCGSFSQKDKIARSDVAQGRICSSSYSPRSHCSPAAAW